MALHSHAGAFNTGTGAGGTTIAVTGVGWDMSAETNAILFWWMGRSESVDTVGRANAHYGFGVATGTASRWAITNRSEDAQASAAAHTNHTALACIATNTGGSAIDGLLDLQSFDADGFTLVVDDQLPADLRVHYLALGGDSITGAETGQFQEPAATGLQDVNFSSLTAATFLLLGGINTATAADGGGGTDSWISIGATDGTNQAVLAGGANHNVATSQTISIAHNSEIYNGPAFGVNEIQDRAAFVQFNSPTAGFRLDWVERSHSFQLHYLAIDGIDALVGDLLTQTDTVTEIVETGFGFEPSGLLFASSVTAEDLVDTPHDHGRLVVGMASSPTERGFQGLLDLDNAADTEVTTAVEHDAVYGSVGSGVVESLLDIVSFDAGGFTAIMDDADASPVFVWYAAFGPADTGGAVPLTGTAAGTTTGSGSLAVDRPLAGAAAASAAVTGEVGLDLALGGSAAGVSTVAGTLSVARPLTGSVAAAASTEGAISLDLALAGVAAGTGAATGELTLSGHVTLAGTAAAQSSGTGALSVQRVLSGVVDAVATAAGDLVVSWRLAGAVSGAATVQGTATVTRGLVGTARGSALLQAEMDVNLALSGAGAGSATLAGSLSVAAALDGIAAGVATVSGTLTVDEAGAYQGGMVEGAGAVSGLVHAGGGVTGRVESGG